MPIVKKTGNQGNVKERSRNNAVDPLYHGPNIWLMAEYWALEFSITTILLMVTRDLSKRRIQICYSSSLSIVRKQGEKIGIQIRPHDLRRYSANYASRNEIPLEVVSKIFLRHQDIKTTQMYLGKITDREAIRWMDVLHGN